MSAQERRIEWLQQLARLAAAGPVHLMLHRWPMSEALEDSRWGEPTARFILAALRTAADPSYDDRLECFVCCQEWSLKRSPSEAVLFEFVGHKLGGVSGICAACLGDTEGWQRAVERDFPFAHDFTLVAPGGNA